MLTRCPACSTTFRVSTETLHARKGKVRCGQCMTVFNALEFLSLEAELLTLPPSGNRVSSSTPAPPPDSQPTQAPQPPQKDVATTRVAEPSETPVAPPNPPTTASFRPLPAWDGKKKSASKNTINRQKLRFIGWLLASLALLILLFGQWAYHYRVDLAAAHPSWRSTLEQLCQPRKCDIPLPQHIDDITLEGSELRPQADGKVQLSATLRNRGQYVTAFPTLEITFTDVNDQVIAVKSLLPTDLLPATKLKQGLPAQTEQTLTITLTTSDLPVVGYRLYLYYP
jgi:predicted Zn finger-like uncharacterized protein